MDLERPALSMSGRAVSTPWQKGLPERGVAVGVTTGVVEVTLGVGVGEGVAVSVSVGVIVLEELGVCVAVAVAVGAAAAVKFRHHWSRVPTSW
jgi:hypothetical protein